MKEFSVAKNDAGQRLDRFVSKVCPLLPGSLAQKYIRIKRIKVNGKGAKKEYKLLTGDQVQMYVNDEFFEAPKAENAYLRIAAPKLDIVYEDENLLLVDKKPGVLVHADGQWSYNTLISQIQAYLFQKGAWSPRGENSFAPALCNRIDRNTGGIVIAAKNAEALRVLNEKIKAREIDKFYLCVVHGRPQPPQGLLEGYLFKDAEKNQVYIRRQPCPGAKTAQTQYRSLAYRDGLSLMECRLLTGRTHQIRAQMADAGWPLLGDGKYGRGSDAKVFGEKGQALYSYKLRFAFKSPAGPLDYLAWKTFSVQAPDFVEKYFPDYHFE